MLAGRGGEYSVTRRRSDRALEEPFATFVTAVDRAIAESEARDVALIGKAATENWQAAAWRLERKMPHKWGRHERHEVTGADGGAIQVKAGIVLLPPETDE